MYTRTEICSASADPCRPKLRSKLQDPEALLHNHFEIASEQTVPGAAGGTASAQGRQGSSRPPSASKRCNNNRRTTPPVVLLQA